MKILRFRNEEIMTLSWKTGKFYHHQYQVSTFKAKVDETNQLLDICCLYFFNIYKPLPAWITAALIKTTLLSIQTVGNVKVHDECKVAPTLVISRTSPWKSFQTRVSETMPNILSSTTVSKRVSIGKPSFLHVFTHFYAYRVIPAKE